VRSVQEVPFVNVHAVTKGGREEEEEEDNAWRSNFLLMRRRMAIGRRQMNYETYLPNQKK